MCMEYLANQVSHQQLNQHLNIADFGLGTMRSIKTKDNKGQDLEMPAVSLARNKKASVRKPLTPSGVGRQFHDH